MDHSLAVNGLQDLQQAEADGDDPFGGERPGPTDRLRQRGATQRLHDDPVLVAVDQDVVDLNHAGVRHRRGGPSFPQRSQPATVPVTSGSHQLLERDRPGKSAVQGEPDRSHAALAEDAEDAVPVGDQLARAVRPGGSRPSRPTQAGRGGRSGGRGSWGSAPGRLVGQSASCRLHPADDAYLVDGVAGDLGNHVPQSCPVRPSRLPRQRPRRITAGGNPVAAPLPRPASRRSLEPNAALKVGIPPQVTSERPGHSAVAFTLPTSCLGDTSGPARSGDSTTDPRSRRATPRKGISSVPGLPDSSRNHLARRVVGHARTPQDESPCTSTSSEDGHP